MKQTSLQYRMFLRGSSSSNASQPSVVQDKACCTCLVFNSYGFAEYLNRLKVIFFNNVLKIHSLLH